MEVAVSSIDSLRAQAIAFQQMADGFIHASGRLRDDDGTMWEASQGAQYLANLYHSKADGAGEPAAKDMNEAFRNWQTGKRR